MSSNAISQSPIDELPAEVLLKAFHVFVKEMDPPTTAREHGLEENMERPIRLTHVCRRWRSAAIDDPSLWTNLHINRWSSAYREFFMRSSPLPIDLSINTISRSVSLRDAERIASTLKTELDRSMKFDHYPVTNRIRSVRLITGGPGGAIAFASILESYNLPHINSFFTRPACSELHNRAYPNFKPPIRSTLTSLALYNLSRGLKTRGLREIFVACPNLETLILGVLELEGRVSHQNYKAPTAVQAQALKTLVVASPIFAEDLVASNLEYIEIAGEVSDGLNHLTPLINQQRIMEGAGEHAERSAVLKVMINAGQCEFRDPERHIPSLSHNIHFHLYTNSVCTRDLPPVLDAWIQATCSTTFYIGADSELDEYFPLGIGVDELGDYTLSVPDPLEPFPHLEPKFTSFPHPGRTEALIPVLIHPSTDHPFLTEASIDPGPYHDPDTLDQTEEPFDYYEPVGSDFDAYSYWSV
ncbi:hypothetical protein NMY22_g1695 [Coprinellus aureogranulatus]|nr:hypothetical protein NMY22_g1695 [Coprinellus aureogranulatus]